MAEPLKLAEGEHRAIDNAGVVFLIGNDHVAPAYNRRDGAEVGLVAGGDDENRLLADEVRQPLLKLAVHLQRAVHKARAGAARTEVVDGLLGGFAYLGVGGQPQVVVRADHNDLAALVADDRAFRVLKGDEEGVEAHGLSFPGARKVLRLFTNIHTLLFHRVHDYPLANCLLRSFQPASGCRTLFRLITPAVSAYVTGFPLN